MNMRTTGFISGIGLLAAGVVPANANYTVRVDNLAGASGSATQATTNLNLNNSDATDSPAVINYPDNGFPTGTQEDNFVLRANESLFVPVAGTYTFGVNSDDGFVLTITGATSSNPANPNGTQGPNELRYEAPRGPADTTADFTFPTAGNYPLQLDFFEDGGGEQVRLFQVVNGGQVDLGGTVTTPEPATLGFLGLGGLGLLARRRRHA